MCERAIIVLSELVRDRGASTVHYLLTLPNTPLNVISFSLILTNPI